LHYLLMGLLAAARPLGKYLYLFVQMWLRGYNRMCHGSPNSPWMFISFDKLLTTYSDSDLQ